MRRVALFRGINVGRAKRVAMADLRRVAEDLGYRDVRTLLNSGNLVFDGGRETPARSGERLQRAVADSLGVSAGVLVLTADDVATVVAENTLVDVAGDASRRGRRAAAGHGDHDAELGDGDEDPRGARLANTATVTSSSQRRSGAVRPCPPSAWENLP
jgi:hypothetical protein